MSLTPEQIEQLRKAVVEATERAGRESGIKGAEVGNVMGRAIRGLRIRDQGYTSLRGFIEKEIPELKVLEGSGADLTYGLATWESLPVRASPSSGGPPDFWRAWVSPAGHGHLAIDRQTGGVRAIGTSEATGEGEARVVPMAIEAHRGIAAEFLEKEELEPSLRIKLQEVLQDPSPDWWRAWNDSLRGTDYLQRWFRYRHERLEAALKQALRDAGLAEDTVQAAHDTILGSRARARAPEVARVLVSRGVIGARGAAPSREDLVRLVLGITPRMSEEELRSLRLPLGLVLDALRGIGS